MRKSLFFDKISVKYIIIFIVSAGIIWLGNLYNDLKFVNKYEIISLRFQTDNKAFKEINVSRVAPSGYISPFVKDKDNNSFYSNKREYITKINITVPEKYLNNINNVEVKIGNKKFDFNKNEFLKEWNFENNNGSVEVYSPDNVSNKRSFAPVLNKIINWPGDFKVFVLSLIIVLLSCSIITVLLFYINKYSKKQSSNDISNIVYWILFVIIIYIAVILRLSLNQVPYSGGDTWGFIGSAVKWFDTNEFVHISGRSFPYPLFVLGVLYIFHDFSYIAITQHLIGVLTGIMILIVWRDIIRSLKLDRSYQLLYDIFGLLLAALFLFSESPINLEHQMRNETIYPFFLILQVFFVFRLILSIKLRSNKVYLYGTLFFVNNYFIFIFQSRWGLALIFNLLIYIVCFVVLNKYNIKHILLFWIIPIILSFVFIYVPENILIKDMGAKRSFIKGRLFWTHAKIVDIELEKDINNEHFDKYNKKILIRIREYLNKAFLQKGHKHKYIGVYLNRLLHDVPDNYLRSIFSYDEYGEFTMHYFLKAVRKHPGKYAKKVLLEMSQFYNFTGSMYTKRKHKVDWEAYADGTNRLSNKHSEYLPYRSYYNAISNYSMSFYDQKKIKVPGIDFIYILLSFTYIFCFILFFAIFIKDIISSIRSKILNENSLFGIIIAIVFFFNFFVILSNSMVYCLDVSRYIDDQFLFVLFANIGAILYIIMNLKKLKKRIS